MKDKFRRLISALLNPETILYVVFGVLTTAINIALAGLFVPVLHWPLLLGNTLAWVASVAFAFITNKLFVFRSKSFATRLLFKEIVTFTAARLLSLGIDSLGMWLWVDLAKGNFWAAKVVMNILVIVMNYILSKAIIFKNKK